MENITKVTLHKGSKAVTVHVRAEDRRLLVAAAEAHGVHWRCIEYTAGRTAARAWSRFLEMRLALHEHRAAPAAGSTRVLPGK